MLTIQEVRAEQEIGLPIHVSFSVIAPGLQCFHVASFDFPEINIKLRQGIHRLAILSDGSCLLSSMPFHFKGSMLLDVADPNRFPSIQQSSELSSLPREERVQYARRWAAEILLDAASIQSRVLGISETRPHSAPTYNSFEDWYLNPKPVQNLGTGPQSCRM